MGRFNVTFEIVTPESAEIGDAESRGFISESVSLRDAMADLFETRTSQCGGVEWIAPNDSEIARARWFTVYNGAEFETGASENRAIHLPDNATAATRARIARLVNGGPI